MYRAVGSIGSILFVWLLCCCLSSPAFGLAGNRAYEMVSPVYKGGYGVTNIHATAPDGDSVGFVSLGGFASVLSASGQGTNEYVAQRGITGWTTASVQPPFGSWIDFSWDLHDVLANGPIGPNAGFENVAGTEDAFLMRDTNLPELAENWQTAGGASMILKRTDKEPLVAIEEGASTDFCHLVIGRTEGPLLLGAVGVKDPIYDLATGCDGQPSLKLVGLNNQDGVINPKCRVELGIGEIYAGSGSEAEGESDFNAVAAGGKELFFTTNVDPLESGNCGTGSHQLFVRIGGTRTLEVSRPVGECTEVPCAGAAGRASAYFKGASEDGSRVFFTTSEPLAGTDEDHGNDLYMATIGCRGGAVRECDPTEREVSSVVQISHDPLAGEAAEVQGVTKLARDGSHLYFVARGVLDSTANAEGRTPTHGADNLYMYESETERTAFVADICSSPGRSGVVEDASCPSDPKVSDSGLVSTFPEAQTSGVDGRFLVFTSYARLLPNDTDTAKDVYRYDAETGALARVSLGEEGYDANGNDGKFDATIVPGHMGGSAKIYLQYEMGTHAISEDGSQIVFTTAGPLSPVATNGLADVYEWDEGSVSLVSSGSAEDPDASPVISPSGENIFFMTSGGLVAEDTDGALDIYDARVGRGFSSQSAPRQPCSGDACQGRLSPAAPLLVPGSISQVPGEEFPPPKVAPRKVVKKKKPKKPSRKHSVRHAKRAKNRHVGVKAISRQAGRR